MNVSNGGVNPGYIVEVPFRIRTMYSRRSLFKYFLEAVVWAAHNEADPDGYSG